MVCIPSSGDRPGGLSQGSDIGLGSQGHTKAAALICLPWGGGGTPAQPALSLSLPSSCG